jgi:hypothetical protein
MPEHFIWSCKVQALMLNSEDAIIITLAISLIGCVCDLMG